MVILLSKRKSKYEREIVEILKKHNASFISDKNIDINNGKFAIISIYKKTEISLNKGIVIFTEKNERFTFQKIPSNLIGICEENNRNALQIFKYNNNAVITCGNNSKNTITLSSISKTELLATLQRSIIDMSGQKIEPCEIKITLTKDFSPFSVMASVAILLLNGIRPHIF